MKSLKKKIYKISNLIYKPFFSLFISIKCSRQILDNKERTLHSFDIKKKAGLKILDQLYLNLVLDNHNSSNQSVVSTLTTRMY